MRARTAAAFSIVILIYIVIVVVFFSVRHLICQLNSSYILEETNQQGSTFCLFPLHCNDFQYFFRGEFLWLRLQYTYLLSDLLFSCTEKGLKKCSGKNILKWSNAGRGMTQEGHRMSVFFGREKMH